jgi:site-specific recombinase XerD
MQRGPFATDRSAALARTLGMTVQIAEVRFPDLETPTRLGTVVSPRFTRAEDDSALVASWLGTFDPVDSRQTLVLYRRVSGAFIEWLRARQLTLTALTTDDLAAWRDQLKGAPATRSNRLAVIKSLLGYAHATGYTRFNVGRAVRGPKVDLDVDSRSLSECDVARLVQAAENVLRLERSRPRPRPRFVRAALTKVCLVRFFYTTGCRVSEVVSVTWADLRARPDGDFQLSVLGKGGKRRRFPLPRLLVNQLETEYRPAVAPADARIFPFGARRAQTIIGELVEAAGLALDVSPHWLRHAAATHALDRGAPVHVVQQTLGHASLATTGRYAHKRMDGAAKYLPRL